VSGKGICLRCRSCSHVCLVLGQSSPRCQLLGPRGKDVRVLIPTHSQSTPLTNTASFNGDTFDPQYVAPAFTGPEPAPEGFEDGKTYHGSCHCGAVTAAVRVNGSLEEGTYKGPVIECNCSFCGRVCYLSLHPPLPS
jgi:hypothetical protein